MWNKESLLFSEEGKWGEVFVSKDENGGGKELVWLFVTVEGKCWNKTIYGSIFFTRSDERDLQCIKAAKEISLMIRKMLFSNTPKRIVFAIDKIALNILGEAVFKKQQFLETAVSIYH